MDMTFDIMDLITIVTIILSIAAGYFKLKHDRDTHTKEIADANKSIERLEEKVKEEAFASGLSRKNLRKEYKEADDKIAEVSNKRIDAVRDAMKEDRDKNAAEFKLINDKLTGMLVILGEIKGELGKRQ